MFDPNGPGGFNGPPGYQRPPQKNRAGLFIVLLVVLLIAVLGIGGVVAYNLASDKSSSPDTTEPGGLDPSDIPTELPTEDPTEPPTEDPTEVPTVPQSTAPTKLPTSGGANAAAAIALTKQFVGQLNANKPTAAAALACPESQDLLPTLIKFLIKPPTKLTVGETLGQTVIIVRVKGTTNGHSVTGIVLVQEDQSGRPCVRALQVAPN
jgi:flagellar basal body-associated protein FliL